MANPFFSIIIPTFNAAKTLSVCMDSVLIQTCKDFEILIVDAVSSDHTMAIVKEYSGTNPAVGWISEMDKGIFDAMNKSIPKAKGEWLYFLGSDDLLYNSDVLNNIKNALHKNPSLDVAYGNVQSTRLGIYDGEFTAKKLRLRNICHQAIFFRKTVFEKIGDYNIKYRTHADWEYNFRWFFSEEIQKKYLDIVIANYTDGGFSSLFLDIEFSKDRRLNYLYYGRHQLPLGRKLIILISESLNSIINGNKRKIISVFRHIKYLLP